MRIIENCKCTSDEIDILDRILTNSKQNFEKFGIQNKLVVVANKCDDINYNSSNDKYDFLDEELEEMYEQIISTVEQRVETVNPDMDYRIVPLGSEDSYIYRMYDENPDYDLDIKHINKFGSNEYGKSRWNRLGEKDKKKVIRKLMNDMDIKDTLKHTGFNDFINLVNNYLNQKIYSDFNPFEIYKEKNDQYPDKETLNQACKLSIKIQKPMCFYYFKDSLNRNICITSNENDKIIYKNEKEHTSPIQNIYKVNTEYLVVTENTIYVTSAFTKFF